MSRIGFKLKPLARVYALAIIIVVLLGRPVPAHAGDEKKDAPAEWLYAVGSGLGNAGTVLFPIGTEQTPDFFQHQMPVFGYPANAVYNTPPSALEWKKLDPQFTVKSSLVMKFHGHDIYCITYREIYPQPHVMGLVVTTGHDEVVLACAWGGMKQPMKLVPFFYVSGQEPGGVSVSQDLTKPQEPAIKVKSSYTIHPGPWQEVWTLVWSDNGPRLAQMEFYLGGGGGQPRIERYDNDDSPAFVKRPK